MAATLAEAGRLVVIEDVVTTGAQLIIEPCAALREQDADIASVLCVVDREAGGADKLAAEDPELRSDFTMSQLRDAAGA